MLRLSLNSLTFWRRQYRFTLAATIKPSTLLVMWLRLRTTRRLRTFLLAAFVHQLNACPCGCLEQNGWYLAVRSLAASVSLVTSPTTTTFGREDLRVEEEHCDCDAQLNFVGQRSSQLDHGAGLFWFAIRTTASISSPGTAPSDGALVNEHSTQTSALEVRAPCQVLRI
jgi:hypothetical protein